ncbi:MAG TPA: VOC family protein [Thermoanaerobaculia bacterium]|nr:VOC family protein [Thermoanaerobaculia bacterium]
MQPGHIGINVTNLDRSQPFYEQLLGLRLMGGSREDGRRFAFLGDGTNIVLTLWEQARERFASASAGLHHLSFRVASLDAVRAAEATARGLGAKLLYDGVVAHREGADSGGIFFEDPDGTRLEIFAPSGLAEQAAPAHGPACGFF